MQKVLHVRATVQPGGKVEIVSPELEAGQRDEGLDFIANYGVKCRMGREG